MQIMWSFIFLQVIAIKKRFMKNVQDLYFCYLKSPKHAEYGLSHFWDYLNCNEYYSEIMEIQLGSHVLPFWVSKPWIDCQYSWKECLYAECKEPELIISISLYRRSACSRILAGMILHPVRTVSWSLFYLLH